MSASSLRIRRQYAPAPHEQLGYTQFIPPMEFPAGPPPEDGDLAAALGWELEVPPGAKPNDIDLQGLIEPTLWERAFVKWVAARLDVALPGAWGRIAPLDGPGRHGALRAALVEAVSWQAPRDVPEEVTIRRAATADGEAAAAAREIRGWIHDRVDRREKAAACDGVLVLLPGGRETIDAWYRTLEVQGLPVRATQVAPLARAPLGQWMIALASLAGWGPDTRRDRAALTAVIQGSFWSAKQLARPGDAAEQEAAKVIRGKMLGAVQNLRRPRISLNGWLEHLGSMADRGWSSAEHALARRFSQGIAEQLTPGPGLVGRMVTLLSSGKGEGLRLHTASTVFREGQDTEASSPWVRAYALLRRLARQEQSDPGGVHPALGRDAAAESLPVLLADAFAGSATVEHQEPRHGVTLMPAHLYDGRDCEKLLLGGLGEGGYPSVPALPDSGQLAWLKALGHDGDSEAWIQQEIEGQIRLAGIAISRCQGPVTLSYSTEGAGTGRVYPGPLLALLVGGWSDELWAEQGDRIEDLSLRDELPRVSGEPRSLEELAARGLHLELPVKDEEEAPLRQHVDELAAIRGTLASSLDALRAREPEPGATDTPFGPYTGLLGGEAGYQDEVFSATALEDYGQCPYLYFLKRVIGVREEEEAGAEPDAMEVGTLVHLVLERVTREVCAEAGAWHLSYPEGDKALRETIIADAMVRLDRHLCTARQEMSQASPSFSRPLLERIGERWRQALENWVHGQVQPVPTHDLSTVDEAPPVAEKLAALEDSLQKRRVAMDALDALRRACEDGDCTSREAAGDFGRDNKLKVGIAKEIFKEWKGASEKDRSAVWDEARKRLQDPLEKSIAAEQAALEQARQAEKARRKQTLSRRVVAAEYPFGINRHERDEAALARQAPLHLSLCGVRFGLTGSIDRVDLDPDRKAWTIRDYKSGKKMSEAELHTYLQEGHKLQLTLYARALEELARCGQAPAGLADAQGMRAGLEFPKVASRDKDTATWITLEPSAQARVNGVEASWPEVSDAWAASHVRGIRRGRYLLRPAHCPLERGRKAFCDFARVCGYSPAHRDRFEQLSDLPAVEPLAEESQEPSSTKKNNAVDVLSPACSGEVIPADRARGEHEAALERARNLERDIIISAGAGTGKTYSLVLRYLQALAAGAAPQQILCITFTRRAAAEMAHRVRQALLNPTPGQQATLAGQLRAEPERFRKILLTLSAAPISTIDSLALRIVQEADLLRAELSGRAAPATPPQVMGEAEMAGTVQRELTDRFLQEMEQAEPQLSRLLDHVTPARLSARLLEAAKDDRVCDSELFPHAQAIVRFWWDLAWRALEPSVPLIRDLDLDEWERLVADAASQGSPKKRLAGEGEASVRAALAAARAIKTAPPADSREGIRLVLAVLDCCTTKNSKPGRPEVGDNSLYVWLRDQIKPLKKTVTPANTEESEVVVQLKKLGDRADEQMARWGELAHATAEVVRRWSCGLSSHLEQRRRLRYADTQRRALRELQDEETCDRLAERFPIQHIFLDESQDTSQVQLDLVRRLAALTGARFFWVGDVKQSIYRFRGAEVDVFQRMEDLGRAEGTDVVHLTVNRRSSRPLIASFNRLFGALLPARSGDVEHDPGSTMDYVPLTWLEQREADAEQPGVELIAAAGKHWEIDAGAGPNTTWTAEMEGGDGGEEGQAEQNPDATELECALIARIQQLCREKPPARREGDDKPRKTGPWIAVLVHAWSRAEHYRELLAKYGVQCVVQGGRGLLSSPEVAHLTAWLEAATLGSPTGLLAALRGPGVALSDTGLFCLRRGYGLITAAGEDLEPKERHLGQVAYDCRLDPERALNAWRSVASLDPERVLPVLQSDAGALARFQQLMSDFKQTCRAGYLSGAVAALLHGSHIRSYWLEQRGGEQQLANIHVFVRFLREQEDAGGSPAEVVSRLLEIRDQDDPAAGSLEAGAETPVCITTYWQAKGCEWPIVVLPDIHRTALRSDPLGAGSERLVLEPDGEAINVPSLVETLPANPFEAKIPDLIKALINRHRMPAERAELRRLLYVAMTRAEERLVISGEFNRPRQDEATDVPARDGAPEKRVTLRQAKDWARTLQVAIDLTFDEQGEPGLGTGVWTEQDVKLCSPANLARAIEQPDKGEPWEPTRVTTNLLRRLAPVVSEPVPRVNPSEIDGQDVPDPWKVHGAYPESRSKREDILLANDEGTAIHALFERWGYGVGVEPTEANVREILSREVLGSGMQPEQDAEHLLAMFRKCRADRPALVATLTAAAARGKLFHEIPIRYRTGADEQVSGDIDLLWHDQDGWHILDYKAGAAVPTADAPLQSATLIKHHAQVSCYAEGVSKLIGGPVADYGIWYTRYGLVVRWRAEER